MVATVPESDTSPRGIRRSHGEVETLRERFHAEKAHTAGAVFTPEDLASDD
jgi:hypothetical protein